MGIQSSISSGSLGKSRVLIEIYEKLLPEEHFTGEPVLKDKKVHGEILRNIGTAYKNLGEPKKAIGYYGQALKLQEK
jgi:tetratricopeptide (TPR) repeat protein